MSERRSPESAMRSIKLIKRSEREVAAKPVGVKIQATPEQAARTQAAVVGRWVEEFKVRKTAERKEAESTLLKKSKAA